MHQYDLHAGEASAEDVQGLYQAFIGSTTRSRAALPGRVSFAPATTVWQASPTAARVSGGLDYSRVVYLHPGGHDLLNASDAADGPGSAVNGTRIVVDGQTYAVEDVDAFGCGADCLLLDRKLHVDVDAASSRRERSSGMCAHGRCLLYTSPSPRDLSTSRMPSSA